MGNIKLFRMVNPKTNIWTIYWADTSSPENYLKEQVVGEFENGIGCFTERNCIKEKNIN